MQGTPGQRAFAARRRGHAPDDRRGHAPDDRRGPAPDGWNAVASLGQGDAFGARCFSRASAREKRRGLTLVEVVCALAVLLIGVLGFSQAVVSALQANVTVRESTLATQAARRQLETIQATGFGQAFAIFNADPTDDPGGIGTSPGAGFAVRGLQAVPGDADGFAGEILFPTAAGAPGILRENAGDPALGMPRDLDGDGVVDGVDHADDYQLLPVVVRVTWRGTRGRGRVELKTLLGEFD